MQDAAHPAAQLPRGPAQAPCAGLWGGGSSPGVDMTPLAVEPAECRCMPAGACTVRQRGTVLIYGSRGMGPREDIVFHSDTQPGVASAEVLDCT